MTALDTGSIATLSFSPKQTFNNVTRVCWDQNMNNLGEGKWINVFVVPAADVAAHLDLPRQTRRLPDTLDVGEVERLLEASTQGGVRDRDGRRAAIPQVR